MMTLGKAIRDRDTWDNRRFEIVANNLMVTQDVFDMLRLITLRCGC